MWYPHCLLCSILDFIVYYSERSQQKNFQLVLITHDMKFVEGIARSCDISEYTLVKKDKRLVIYSY